MLTLKLSKTIRVKWYVTPIFCVLLYIIVVLNTQRLGAFVLNVGAFCANEDIYDMWKLQYYKHFRMGVFF